jgi:hypothetical protein
VSNHQPNPQARQRDTNTKAIVAKPKQQKCNLIDDSSFPSSLKERAKNEREKDR